MHSVTYTKKAIKDLRSIEVKIAQRIIGKIFEYSKTENPLKFAKKLKGSILGDYRFRIGDYRAVFDIDAKGNVKILVIMTVKHRKDVYKEVR